MYGLDAEGQKRRNERSLRQVTIIARQGTQSKDASAEENQEPGVRRGLYILRNSNEQTSSDNTIIITIYNT